MRFLFSARDNTKSNRIDIKLETAKAKRSDFDQYMNMIPDNAPLAGDELPT
jgi:hypothetical protein